MQKLAIMIRNALLSTAVVMLTFFFPVAAYADDAPVCTPPSSNQAGVHVPTGSSAGTYTYNCDTGLWENAHYTYDPSSGVTLPKDAVVYVYNDSTGLWDVSTWQYSAAAHNYFLVTDSVNTPPAGAQTEGGPAPVINTPAANGSLASAQINNGGPGSDNTINGSSNTGINSSNNTGMTVGTGLNSVSLTGDAWVTGNTTGGSAGTGNAQAMANIVNMLQSTTSAFGMGGNAVTFVSNIDGDVNGDLLLDPASLAQIQNASGTINLDNTLAVNADNSVNAHINNDIDLAAQSGNAGVDSNTSAGDATSGNASAVANIINMINSVVGSGQSFLGVININGNLNGDILLPPDFVDQLLASNTPSASINTAEINTSNSLTALNDVNQAINNNVHATADTGAANVSQNTSAGNATTGDASTNVTVFNLTGSKVVGANDLLVFVNVLGHWVGMIVNAPAGSTAASLGGHITENSTTDVNLANNVNTGIDNNINVNAQSGDASVTKNTKGGNATSGNANAAVNLLNMSNSSLNLANWFGVLFINVFGTWHGSFGVNTSAGDPVAAPGSSTDTASQNGQIRVFRFVANNTSASGAGSSSDAGSSNDVDANAVLAAHTTTSGQVDVTPTVASVTNKAHRDFWVPIIGSSIAVFMLAAERIRSIRRPNN